MNESMLWLLRDTRKARKQGMNAIKERQRARLAEIVAFARDNSPYYRELTHLLTGHKLDHVTVERAEEPPEQSPGGKFRKIIPLS